MKLIPLSKNGKHAGKYFAQVDDEDYEYLNQWNYYVVKSKSGFYAARGLWDNSIKNNRNVPMQNDILHVEKGLIVDHIDRNGLNNTRANLRACTKQQNNQNRSKVKKATSSKYIGAVFVDKKKTHITASNTKIVYSYKRWACRIKLNGKTIYIGDFKTEIEAAIAYNKKAKELFGEFANLNVIE